jgi:hypothetical protein
LSAQEILAFPLSLWGLGQKKKPSHMVIAKPIGGRSVGHKAKTKESQAYFEINKAKPIGEGLGHKAKPLGHKGKIKPSQKKAKLISK